MEVQPSRLGTKGYWDSVYQEELANFEEIGDEGEIWFGAETVDKMVEWSLENIPPSSNASILEIGSGNGTLLFGLLDAGYDPARLCGIDYSPGAVALSTQIAQTRGGSMINFTECDFLQDDPPILEALLSTSRIDVWDLILDKGTYDAISLGQKDDQGRPPSISYPDRAARLLKPGGYFLITSCNFTEDELKSNFSTTGFTYQLGRSFIIIILDLRLMGGIVLAFSTQHTRSEAKVEAFVQVWLSKNP